MIYGGFMKKLLLSLLFAIVPLCAVKNTHQRINKTTLRSIKKELVHALREIEQNLKDLSIQSGDLSIIFLKMSNECLSHDISQKIITETSINAFDVILEQQSVKSAVDNFVELPVNQNDIEKFQKVWQDILKKYEEKVRQIYHQMVEKCNNSDISLKQCEMLHISFYDFPQIYVTMSFSKVVCSNVLKKIELLL
jgi:hypothetical protein